MAAPNLDDMDVDALETWAMKHGRSRRAAQLLFPGHHTGIVLATRDLVNYAWNKATAQRERLAGRVPTALQYEGICQRIYDGLPTWARW